jgi:hypothetical protein
MSDPIADRTAEILALTRSHPRITSLSEAERLEWARSQAEKDLANVSYLPGGLSWSQIEAAYRKLARQSPGLGSDGRPFRRTHPRQPSRPELAAALLTSPATLDRACIKAGRGKQWPPRGL